MYSKKLDRIKPFRVMEVLARAAELTASGHHVVHFEVGEPDFPTAQPIVDAGSVALRSGLTKYTSAVGITPLREAISAFIHQDSTNREIFPTPGRNFRRNMRPNNSS